MLSPAQPSPSAQPQRPASREKKCIIFTSFFRQRYSRTVKSCCSKIEKIKFWIHQIFNENQCFLMIFRRKLNVKKSTRRSCNGFQGAISALDTRRKIVLFSRVFRVLSEPLQDRRVDFFVLRAASGSSTLRTT